MIGNDVVDLLDRDADSSSYRPGFDVRVFTREERCVIAASREPERQRWRLWAAKEAAFKAARKCDLTTVFSPSAFAVSLESDGENLCGIVDHLGTRYRVLFNESQRWIHAIASRGARGFERIISAVRPNDDPSARGESLAVRVLAREHLARHLGVRLEELQVRADARIPWVWLKDRRLDLSLSLSHSGGIVAFACGEGDQRIG